MLSPALRKSISVCIGTRVPANTEVPPITSFEDVTTGAFISRSIAETYLPDFIDRITGSYQLSLITYSGGDHEPHR